LFSQPALHTSTPWLHSTTSTTHLSSAALSFVISFVVGIRFAASHDHVFFFSSP
jgi:hypothetical protein